MRRIFAAFPAVILTVVLTLPASGRQPLKKILANINQQTSEAVIQKKLGTLLSYYDSMAVILPEYHGSVYGGQAIGKYWQQWLDSTSFTKVSRTIVDLQELDGYAIETGTFASGFSKPGGQSAQYDGKYLRIWKAGTAALPKIMMDIWGAALYIDRHALPLIQLAAMAPAKIAASSIVRGEVTKRNQVIREMVMKRQGLLHAGLFTKDAIYGPYYMPWQMGIEPVTAYFEKHETPAESIDSLDIHSGLIIDLGNIIIEHGLYGVKWRVGSAGGVTTGKSINVWRRENGELMLYRQMVNHD